jgi:energy-coupling factor transport system permease protein
MRQSWPGKGVSAVFKNIAIGQYYPGNSLIHRLDPRTKIITTFAFIVCLFLVRRSGYVAVTALAALLVVVSRVPIRFVARGLRPILFIALLTFFLNALVTPGLPLFSLGPLVITREGLYQGVFLVWRLILLVLITSFLTLTTPPVVLTDGIESLLRPFRRFGVPAHELAMMMTIALRFIPTLLEEAEKIMKAQMARGADFESGNIIQRAKNLIPLLIPLFVSAFRRADDLAVAMEARCYHGGENRTRLKELHYHTGDYLVYGCAALLFALVLWARR